MNEILQNIWSWEEVGQNLYKRILTSFSKTFYSLSLNFLLYNFQVNGQNVVGMKDKDITKIIDEAGQVVTITVIPNFLYKHIMKK